MNSFDKLGYIINSLSKTLKEASGCLRIKAAHDLERSEAILEKYEGNTNG